MRIRGSAVDVVLWGAALLCAAMTLWWSLASVPPGASLFVGVDKLEHGLAYFVTSLLFLLAAVWRPGRGDGVLARWSVWVAVALVAAGGLVEVLQSLIGRDAEVRDWLAEIVAVALAWGVVRAWSALRPSG